MNWYCYWTEEWEWQEALGELLSKTKNINDIYVLAHVMETEWLPKLSALRREVEAYHPQYAHVQNLQHARTKET